MGKLSVNTNANPNAGADPAKLGAEARAAVSRVEAAAASGSTIAPDEAKGLEDAIGKELKSLQGQSAHLAALSPEAKAAQEAVVQKGQDVLAQVQELLDPSKAGSVDRTGADAAIEEYYKAVEAANTIIAGSVVSPHDRVRLACTALGISLSSNPTFDEMAGKLDALGTDVEAIKGETPKLVEKVGELLGLKQDPGETFAEYQERIKSELANPDNVLHRAQSMAEMAKNAREALVAYGVCDAKQAGRMSPTELIEALTKLKDAAPDLRNADQKAKDAQGILDQIAKVVGADSANHQDIVDKTKALEERAKGLRERISGTVSNFLGTWKGKAALIALAAAAGAFGDDALRLLFGSGEKDKNQTTVAQPASTQPAQKTSVEPYYLDSGNGKYILPFPQNDSSWVLQEDKTKQLAEGQFLLTWAKNGTVLEEKLTVQAGADGSPSYSLLREGASIALQRKP